MIKANRLCNIWEWLVVSRKIEIALGRFGPKSVSISLLTAESGQVLKSPSRPFAQRTANHSTAVSRLGATTCRRKTCCVLVPFFI